MKKLLALIAATAFAMTSTAFAQTAAPAKTEPPKADAKAAMKMEKPAAVSQADWDKMTDADKKKAVDKAKSAAPAQSADKKPKKGGC